MKDILELSGTIGEIAQTLFSDCRAERTLDVATGRGGMIGLMYSSLNDFDSIHGIDANFDIIKEAKSELGEDDISLAQMDAVRMGFQSGSFNLVSIGFSLHHLDNVSVTLGEIWRVMKTGGVCVVSEMYSDGLTNAQLSETHLHHFVADIDQAFGITHNHTLTRKQIIDHIIKISWKQVTIYSYKPMMDADPQDAIKSIDKQVSHHLNRARELEHYSELTKQGTAIREWVRKWGMQRASVLLMKCVK